MQLCFGFKRQMVPAVSWQKQFPCLILCAQPWRYQQIYAQTAKQMLSELLSLLDTTRGTRYKDSALRAIQSFLNREEKQIVEARFYILLAYPFLGEPQMG